MSLLGAHAAGRLRAAYPGTPVVRVDAEHAGRGRPRRDRVRRRRGRRRRDDLRARCASCSSASATVVDVPERLMDVAGAVLRRRPRLLGAGRRGAGRRRRPPRHARRARRSTLVIETMAGTAELLRARGCDTLGVRREVTSPGGTTARGPGRARARRRARGVRRAPWTPWWARVTCWRPREQIADFLGALICGLHADLSSPGSSLSLVFSLGVRVPYYRVVNAVLDFLRDVVEPYLRLFRRLPLHRPARPQPDRRDPRAADRRRHRRRPDRRP